MDPKDVAQNHAALAAMQNALRQLRGDGWENSVTKMGTSGDPSSRTQFVGRGRIPDTTLTNLYADNSLAKRIAREMPASCFRRGVEVDLDKCDEKSTGIDDDDRLEEELNAKLVSLDLYGNFVEAVTMARLYGGSLLVAGLNDGGDLSEPLNESNINSLPHLTVYDRRYVHPESWYEEPGDELLPEYGKPKLYRLYAPMLNGRRSAIGLVHASRTIEFQGAPTTVDRRISNLGWNDSVFQSLYDTLTSNADVWGGVERMLKEAAQGVLRVKGLISALASPNGRQALTSRAEYFDLMRVIARTIFLDADSQEDYKRDQIAFSGISDLLDKHMLRVCSETEYPATVLYGRSPAGLAATGENEMKQYNVKLRAAQESYIPHLTKLVRWILQSRDFAGGRAAKYRVKVSFPSLWDLTDAEASTKRKTEVEADKMMLDADVYLPEEIALARAKRDKIKIDRDARLAALGLVGKVPDEVKQVELTPSAAEGFTLVREARAAMGLPPFTGEQAQYNDLTVAGFRALQEAPKLNATNETPKP